MNALLWTARFAAIWVGVWLGLLAIPTLVMLHFFPLGGQIPLAYAAAYVVYGYACVLPATMLAITRGGDF